MDGEAFNKVTRQFAGGELSRRATLKALAVGGAASLFGRFTADAEAAGGCGGVCEKKNWCVDRTHTCGPGKCFVRRFGGRNICAEVLFQAQTCDACKEPACVGCKCVLATGGGDKCNNGTNGFDYICVRPVA
jgi:hypothetical protein